MKCPYHIGTKFYKYEDEMDAPHIIRLTKFKDMGESGILTFKDVDGKYIKLGFKEFDSAGYVKLKPNALLTFNLVKIKDLADVMVCMHRETDGTTPYAVCRQSISDVFANTINPNSKFHYVGLSISQDTCPSNMRFENVLSCDTIESTHCVSVYITDSLEEILSLVNQSKYDTVLRLMASKCEGYRPTLDAEALTGYESSLKGMLAMNKFMYDFHTGMEVIEGPFLITEDTVELRNEDHLFLEDKLSKRIERSYILPYTEMINLMEFSRDYVLVYSILNGKVYVIGYDELSEK